MKSLAAMLKGIDDANTSPTSSPMSSLAEALTGAASGRIVTMSQVLEERCPVCGGAGFVVPDLPIGHPDFGKALPCRCRQQERLERRLRNFQRMGNLETLRRLSFENFDPAPGHYPAEQQHALRRAYDNCTHYAQEPENWLLLIGGYGCGKTHLAAAIANARLDLGEPVLFMVVPDLLDHLRTTYNPESEIGYDELFEELRNTPLLILDDLGAQSSTAWAQEKLFQLLNHRYNAQLPTVITTNQRLEDIEPRLRSRLLDQHLVGHVRINAPDYRAGSNPAQSDLSSLGFHQEQRFSTFEVDRGDLKGEERLNLRGVAEVCQEYAKEPQGWLVLSGANGCGKTHLAAAIANEWSSHGNSVMFIVTPDLLDHLRAAYSPQATTSYDQRFDTIKNVALLVLDDLGTESATPWAREKLYQLLNYRYNAQLPTIITTSAGPYEIEPWLRSRMFDQRRCQYKAITAPGYIPSRTRQQHDPNHRPRRAKPGNN
jgi:DNA replication protein DnaC